MTAVKRRAANGFTIIEVLIVLAIAGLILLIVFQAIPALERNGHNNRRKQDVTVVLEKISNYELNNTANIPDTPTLRTRLGNELTIYDPANVTVTSGHFGQPVDEAAVTSLDALNVYNYQRCSPTVAGAGTSTGAGYTDVVVLYAVETGNNGVSSQCQQL